MILVFLYDLDGSWSRTRAKSMSRWSRQRVNCGRRLSGSARCSRVCSTSPRRAYTAAM